MRSPSDLFYHRVQPCVTKGKKSWSIKVGGDDNRYLLHQMHFDWVLCNKLLLFPGGWSWGNMQKCTLGWVEWYKLLQPLFSKFVRMIFILECPNLSPLQAMIGNPFIPPTITHCWPLSNVSILVHGKSQTFAFASIFWTFKVLLHAL